MEENLQIEEMVMMQKSVKEIKENPPVVSFGMESYVTIGAGDYPAFIHVNDEGDLILIPETPTEGFKRTVIHNAKALYEKVIEIEELRKA